MPFVTDFLTNVWDNEKKKKLFNLSRILTCALLCGVVPLLHILFRCLIQHIQSQRADTKVTLQVLMALRHPEQNPPKEAMNAWLLGTQKATV